MLHNSVPANATTNDCDSLCDGVQCQQSTFGKVLLMHVITCKDDILRLFGNPNRDIMFRQAVLCTWSKLNSNSY